MREIQNKPFKNTVIHARIKNESRAVLISKLVTSFFNTYIAYNAYDPNSSSVFSSATMPYTASGDSDHQPHRSSKYPRFLEFHLVVAAVAARRGRVAAPRPRRSRFRCRS